MTTQDYIVVGETPADGFYYTIINEPSFHEYADPAFLHIYNQGKFNGTEYPSIKGKLRFSVNDSIVTFTEQPLVSFDSNGGAWTTEMEGYHDRDGDRKVYQKAVTSGETVSVPSPDPVYPTAEGIGLLGWTENKAFAEADHTPGEDISANAYQFNTTPVTEPKTLYAVWAKLARDYRVVTVKNGFAESLAVTATLTQGDAPVTGHDILDGLLTDDEGKATVNLPAGDSKNLSIPDGVALVLSVENSALIRSSEFTDADTQNNSFTIESVNRDGTVNFTPGICKITDSAGKILYENDGNPAVYGTLTEAFTAYVGTLYTDVSHTTTATPAAVKLLVDEYYIEEATPIALPNATMTLTTAGKTDADFPYLGARDRCIIYRTAAGANNRCFTQNNNSKITVANIVVDGGSENGVKIAKTANGGLFFIEGGTLTVEAGTTLRNCEYADYTDGNNSRGGAINIKNGTLNVNAGLFTNLHARNGGAIYADNTAILNLRGANGSTRFENCNAEVSGGAVYYNNTSANITIDGGNDNGFKVDAEGNTQFDADNKKIEASNPGVVFYSCTAKDSNEGNGGAIFIISNGTASIHGCSFAECSAKVNKNDDRTRGGGAIAAKNVNSITVSNCTFNDCDTLTTGGALFAKIKDGTSLTVNNCIFRNDSCKGQGGGIGVYQVNEGAKTTAQLTVNGCRFENCSSGTQNGSGGAIQSYLPCMSMNNSDFTDCWAGKEGGGINNYFGSNYTEQWNGSFMTIKGCEFTRCRAEDRFQVDIVIHYGGAINTKVKTVNVEDCKFVDCVSTLRDGGALHLGGCGAGTSATIKNSTFTGCTAKKHGGAVFSSAETLEISGSKFYGCMSTAECGGAVYHGMNCRSEKNVKEETKITDCEFKQGCSAAINGSAVWTAAKSAEIKNCTVENCTSGNSGAIYLSEKDVQINTSGNKETGTTAIAVPLTSGALTRGTISGGSVTGCEAVSGSAVYVGHSATFSGNLEVSGNTVSSINDGAIHGGALYFEGNVKVEDNTCSSDATYDHDVLMQNDNLTTIQTTSSGLETDAKIGVYVPDQNSRYTKYGLEGQKFGTFANNDYLDAFFNDRNDELYGYEIGGDSYIYWGIYVCKITDADGNTLIRPNGKDAVYQRLTMALDEFNSVKDANGEGGKAKYIKMLVENYNIRQTGQFQNFPAADITLTTATKHDEPNGNKYPYRGTEGTVCTISRNNSTDQLFKLDNANTTLRLENITMDGRKDKTTARGDYRLIEAAAGELIINSGTTMQYGYTGGSGRIGGGAIYATNASVTINGAYSAAENAAGVHTGVLFMNCVAENDSNGGAIWANNLTIKAPSGTENQPGTAFIGCTAKQAGAICINGSTTEINGALFKNCQSQTEGGAIYHLNTSATTTTIKNSLFEKCYSLSGNWAYGGALHSKAAELSVSGCSFTDCASASNGGAIYHGDVNGNHVPNGSREKTTISNTTFDDCKTTGEGADSGFGSGGSIYTQAKTVEIVNSRVSNSVACDNGGALYCRSDDAQSSATISGTTFDNCSASRDTDGSGGAIYSRNKELTLNKSESAETTINACTAKGYSGAVHMDTDGSVLNIKDSTVISACYANKGGAIYLKSGTTMNLADSPDFAQNGYTTQGGSIVNAEAGACIYLEEDSRINLKGSPQFSRNILPNKSRITNGGITDYVRQDIYMAGYQSDTEYATNAKSIYVVGELTGDTIWVWPEQSPHRKPNEQFAKIEVEAGATVSADSLSLFRNALADEDTHCSNGEYLAGVQVGTDTQNVYWDKMYTVSFRKIDNKGVTVPKAGFTLYANYANGECSDPVATVASADGESDKDAAGKFLGRGVVEFNSIRIGAYYMKETQVPISFKENETVYLVLVGTPYLSKNDGNRALWEGDGPLNVADAETLVTRYTTDAGKYYGIFPLDKNGKAVLRANLASNTVGVENIRNDYQVSFMKVDGSGNPLPGAAFTIYESIPNSSGEPDAFEDGYPKLRRWSRDGETYPAPVVSADGTAAFKDVNNQKLPKGMVYFRELPMGTYYLLETAYPERNSAGRRTYFAERDRVFKLVIEEDETSPTGIRFSLSEWIQNAEYRELSTDDNGYYLVDNQEVVCKLTDANDQLLYVNGHQIWENMDTTETTVRRFPAIYATLEEGFEAAQNGSFVDANGNSVSVDALKLKVLKDFTISEPVVVDQSARAITFTTAETKATKDRYIFSTTRTSDTSRALISRAYSEDTAENANAGALITLANGAEMTLQNIRLNGQKTQYNGRAIHVTGSSSLHILNNTRIENFRQEASADSVGSDLKGGAILMENGTSLTIDGGYNRTAIFSGNTVVNNRSDGADTGSDGGAIAVGEGCSFSISNAQFSNNQATAATEKKGNGGAVSINRTKDADEMLNLPVSNVVFSNNKASYQGGALRVAENCSLVVNNCTFSNNKANTYTGQTSAPGEGGAIAVLSKQASPSSLTITGGTFTGNTAEGSKGGAVKIGGYGTLTLGGNLTMGGNEAENGGAVTVAPGATVTMTQGTIRNNKATGNGGAFYLEGKLEDDKEVRGTLTVKGGAISGNKAGLGSAIFAEDYAAATITDAAIMNNTASEDNGGAINVEGDNARLYFGGKPTVFDNFGKKGSAQQMNLVLSENSNDVINTTTGGLSGGIIGVYVVESKENVFTNHGLPGTPFGTFGDSGRRNPQVFRNDHSLALYGVKNDSNASDNNVYWVDVICKLTDANDKILYQDISLTINGKKETRKAQAVYARITEYGDTNAIQNGFNALRDGFEAAQGTLYSRSADKYSAYARTAQTVVKLKMLKDAELDKSIQVQGSRKVTFTTAETEADLTLENIQTMRAGGDYFLFKTKRTDAAGKALIERGFDGSSMIQDKATALTLTNIVLDGGAVINDEGDNTGKSTTANGGIVNVTAGKLTVADGATLRNSETTTGNGGAVYVAASATAEMTGGTITGCSAANGGAVYADSGATMELKDGATATGATAKTTSATINGNTAATNGAGICLEEGAKLELEGHVSFGGTGRNGNNADAEIITEKTEGGRTVILGNYVENEGALSADARNGQKEYRKLRQDIYMAGYQGVRTGTTDPLPATSIVVTGKITSGAGSIWVAAEKPGASEADAIKENNHYEMLKQFAVFKEDVASDETTMHAFRNAWDDESTGCGADYLTGQDGDDLKDANGTNWKCIYWTGGFDFVFRKLKEDGEPLDGAKFTLFMAVEDPADSGSFVPAMKDSSGKLVKATSADEKDWAAYEQSNPDKAVGGRVDATAESKSIVDADAVKIKYTGDGGTNVEEVSVYGDGLALFEKIPPGVYFMVEKVRTKKSGGGYDIATGAPLVTGKTVNYQAVEEMYRVVIDGKGWYAIHVADRNADGQPVWDKAKKEGKVYTWPDAINAPTVKLNETASGSKAYTDKGAGTATIDLFTAMNLSPLQRKVILKKVDGSNTPLNGAVFTVLYADKKTPVRVEDGTDASGKPKYDILKDKESGTAGAFWIGKLPYGTYYLNETKNASGQDVDLWFTLTVNETGVGYETDDLKVINTLSPSTTAPD